MRDENSEEVPSFKVRVVQRVYIRSELPSQHSGQGVAIRDGGDRIELWLQWSDPLRLNGRFIHVARVKVAYSAAILTGSGASRSFDKLPGALPCLVA